MSTPGGFKSQTRPQEVGFAKQFVQPPSARYITRDDRLYILSYAVTPGETLAIRARILTPTGEVVTLDFAHAVDPFARISGLEAFDLREGFLLDVGVFNTGGTIRRGEVYVQIGLLRGNVNTGSFVTTLASGYIEGLGSVFWPDGPIESTIAGPGRLFTLIGTDPIAQCEILETVPTNARWKIHSFSAILTTQATGGNRRVYLQFQESGPTILYRVATVAIHGNNLTITHTWRPGMEPNNLLGGRMETSLTDCPLLLQGGFIGTDTRNFQANDNWTSPTIVIEEWIEE